GAARKAARLPAHRARAGDRSGLRPAPQDAASEPEAAGRRSARAPDRHRHRADRAGRAGPDRRIRCARPRARGHAALEWCPTQLRRQSLTTYAAPLCETIVECPQPKGAEVLVRIRRCGVCHSDLHIHDGYFLLGDDKKLDVRAGRALPFTLGHEIAGVVERVGEDAAGVAPGDAVAVYPWIGCGNCAACRRGDENICAAPRHLGINVDGGYASHVLVPHARYLIDYAPLPDSFAATLMCSGLTAYAALKRLAPQAALGPLLLVGMGGVGMMGLALARAMFAQAPLVADVDAAKRQAALAAGAAAAFDPGDPTAR